MTAIDRICPHCHAVTWSARRNVLDRRQQWQVLYALFYGKSAKEIGEYFGVSRATIVNVLHGRRGGTLVRGVL